MAKILIADDYDDNRELLRYMLETAGHEIHEARDGKECVDMALGESPDIILIDLSMPVLDGWNVLMQLRDNSKTKDTPCVAVTAFPVVEGEFVNSNAFDAYLPKPFQSRDLLSMVGRLLADRPLINR